MPEYYTYGYKFYEPKAGEVKDHKEFRNGGLIFGSLNVVEKSGVKTNITYEGLPWSGWQALIETQDSAEHREIPRSTLRTPAKQTMTLECAELTNLEASSQLRYTGASSATTKEAGSKNAFTEGTSKLTSAVAASKTSSSKTSIDSKPTTPKPWFQIYRISPYTGSAVSRTSILLGDVAQGSQKPPARILAKSLKQFPTHPIFPMQPYNRITAHGNVYPMLKQRVLHVFSDHDPPRRQPSKTVLKPTSAPQRKSHSIRHGKTTRERRHRP